MERARAEIGAECNATQLCKQLSLEVRLKVKVLTIIW